MKPSEYIKALFDDELSAWNDRNTGAAPELWAVEDMRFRALCRFLDEQHEASRDKTGEASLAEGGTMAGELPPG